MLATKYLIIFITSLVTFMKTTKAFSQEKLPVKTPWWVDYRETLRQEGAMDIPRPIKIKASKASSSSRSKIEEMNNSQDESHIVTKVIHFQRYVL